jgi:hypothetical protein
MSADPEISCPPIRSQLSAHPDLRVSVGSGLDRVLAPRFGHHWPF